MFNTICLPCFYKVLTYHSIIRYIRYSGYFYFKEYLPFSKFHIGRTTYSNYVRCGSIPQEIFITKYITISSFLAISLQTLLQLHKHVLYSTAIWSGNVIGVMLFY